MPDYGPDLTTEAGAFASSGGYPSNAFRDSIHYSWVSNADDTAWIGNHIVGGASINKITIQATIEFGDWNYKGDVPTAFDVRAANSEPIDGSSEGVLLLSVVGEDPWAEYEIREYVFSNTETYTHYWIYMTDKENAFGDSVEYRILEMTMHELDVPEFTGEDVASLSGSGDYYATYSISDGDSAALTGSGAAFDYTAMVNLIPYSVDRYWAILTGGPDGLTDLTIPISQFSARYQTGRNSYLSVVVPDYAEYISGIEARSNGELILMGAYYYGGVSILEQEILRVDPQNVNVTIGSKSAKIVLDGYRETAVVGSTVSMSGPTYSQLQAGVTQYTFPFIDFYLRPGDTITIGDDEAIVVDSISYNVTAKRRNMTIKSG